MNTIILSSLIVGGAGLIFALSSIPFFLNEKRLKRVCTATTTGKVIGYRISGGSNAHSVAPRVEFFVDGKRYTAYRHYKAVASGHVKSINPLDNFGDNDYFYISDKDVFHIRTMGAFHNYFKLGEEVWPKGTELKVVYNPDKPKEAFVDKVVTISKVAGIVFLSTGCGIMALALLIALLLG